MDPTIFVIVKQTELDDANFVGDIQSVVVGGEFDVSLLGTVGSNECVDLGDLDFVHLLGGLSSQRVLDGRELVQSWRSRARFGRAFWVSRKTKGLWPFEVNGSSHFLLAEVILSLEGRLRCCFRVCHLNSTEIC